MSKTLLKLLSVVSLLLSLVLPTTVSAKSLQSVIDQYCRTSCITETNLLDVAYRAATRYKIDIFAILAIIHTESKYNIKAQNSSSVGLTQVHLKYHKPKFVGKNYFDIEDNIFAGMQVFRDCLIRTKGNYDKAYGCYNGGGDSRYISKVKSNYAMLKLLDIPQKSNDPIRDFLAMKVKHNDEENVSQETGDSGPSL